MSAELVVESLTTYERTGGGTVYIIQIPEDHPLYGKPRKLMHRRVNIDGRVSSVIGVETHCVQDGHPALKGPCGVLLSEN